MLYKLKPSFQIDVRDFVNDMSSRYSIPYEEAAALCIKQIARYL